MKYPKRKTGDRIAAHPARLTLAERPPGDWPLLRWDGGVTGNGSADAVGRWGFILTDAGGRELDSGSGPAGGRPVTVNTCEWEGLFNGLLAVRRAVVTPGVRIEGDSDLVVSQLAGRWQARGDLAVWRNRCLDVLHAWGRPWAVRWIPRAENAACDRLTRGPRAAEPGPVVRLGHVLPDRSPAGLAAWAEAVVAGMGAGR